MENVTTTVTNTGTIELYGYPANNLKSTFIALLRYLRQKSS
jgi:hypothetical protein